MPADEPGVAFSRPDLPGKNHQTATAEKAGGRTVIAHFWMVSQPVAKRYESRFSASRDSRLSVA